MLSPPTLGPWALDLGPSASRTISLITTGIILGMDIREYTEDLEGFGIASDEVVSQMRQKGPWRVWENFRGCGPHSERALEGVVRATDGVVSALEQLKTASERVMNDTETYLRTSKQVDQV